MTLCCHHAAPQSGDRGHSPCLPTAPAQEMKWGSRGGHGRSRPADRGLLRAAVAHQVSDEVLGDQEAASQVEGGCDPRPRSMCIDERAKPPPSSPAPPTHLVQEAHEVVEHRVVVFRKALQDLAAAGHPQAALHTCDGTRALSPCEGQAQVEGGQTAPRAGLEHLLTSLVCRFLLPAPSPSSQGAHSSPGAPGPNGLLLSVKLPWHPAYGCFHGVELGPLSPRYFPSGPLQRTRADPTLD